jgi:hypothetical protein
MPAPRSTFVTDLRYASKLSRFRYTSSSYKRFMPKLAIHPDEIPNYTLEESARYLRVAYSKVGYWVIGDDIQSKAHSAFIQESSRVLCLGKPTEHSWG